MIPNGVPCTDTQRLRSSGSRSSLQARVGRSVVYSRNTSAGKTNGGVVSLTAGNGQEPSRFSEDSKSVVQLGRPRRCSSSARKINASAGPGGRNRRSRESARTPEGVLALLRLAYGDAQIGALDEKLKGFKLLAADAVIEDNEETFDLTYGEVLPQGVTKALGPERLLPSAQARVLLDLGMGTGKFAMQAFLEVPWLEHVLGMELTHARFNIAAKALKKLAARNPGRFGCQVEKDAETGQEKCLTLIENSRSLEFRLGDIFQLETELVNKADAIVMAVAFPAEMTSKVQQLLKLGKQGCRLLTYEDHGLENSHTWDPPAPRAFARLPCNGSQDHYPVSWVPKPGHAFYLHEVGAFQKQIGSRKKRLQDLADASTGQEETK